MSKHLNSGRSKAVRSGKSSSRFGIFSIFRDTIVKYPGVSVLLALAITGSVLLTVIVPLVLGEAVDRLTDKTAVSVSLAVLYFSLIALQGVLDAGKEALITMFGQKVTHGLRSRMYQKMIRLPASYFVNHEYGEITSRFVNDADTIEELFSSGIISMVSDAASIIGVVIVIFTKSSGLGIILCIVLPLLFAMTRAFQKRMLAAQKKNRAAIAREGAVLPETLSNIRTIHLFHSERFYEKRYEKAIQDSFDAMEDNNFYDACYSPIIVTVSSAVIGVMMTLSGRGGVFLKWFGMTAGTAVAVINYVNNIFEPLAAIGMEIQSIQSAMAGISRIRDFLNEKELEILPEDPEEEECGRPDSLNRTAADAPTSKRTAIRLKNVDFSYDSSRKILDHFSLEVKEGEHLTLSGRTGIGKSTLFRLILGLYQPDEGEVSVFGRRPDAISPRNRRKMFGYVEQNFVQVPGSVRDQITLGDETIPDEDIWEALKVCHLEETVRKLPQQENTECDRSMFSQGQWQLLSIARAIVCHPRILLLDEITANLDSDTEHLVLDTLKEASESRTVLSISHRLYEVSEDRKVQLTDKSSMNRPESVKEGSREN